MDDLPERETPRVWIAAGIFLAAITLAFVMLVYNSIQAHAQQVQCAPIRSVVDMLAVSKERVLWGGVTKTAQGVSEILLFQSPQETWTLVTVQNGIGCIVAEGRDGTPIETGRGV